MRITLPNNWKSTLLKIFLICTTLACSWSKKDFQSEMPTNPSLIIPKNELVIFSSSNTGYKMKELNKCYSQAYRPSLQKNSWPAIYALASRPDDYLPHAKIYLSRSACGVDTLEMLATRQLVNIGMRTEGFYDKERYKHFIIKNIGIDIDQERSYYTSQFEKTHTILPTNFTLYTRTPAYDKLARTVRPLHIIHVSAAAFDSEEQPDYKYFIPNGSFTTDAFVEYRAWIGNIFKKIVRCARDHNLTSIYINGPGCGAFSGPVKDTVIGVYNEILSRVMQSNPNIRFINGFTEDPKIFTQEGELNCFSIDWCDAFGAPEEILFVNNWDPHAHLGNGNSGDNSVDGKWGRNTPIAFIGSPAINEYLLRPENCTFV